MLSENIYALRKKAGLSQEQLAEKIGVSRQAISKWEVGLSCPELDKLRALSQFFNVSIDELTSGHLAETANSQAHDTSEAPRPRTEMKLGIVLCLLGLVMLFVIALVNIIHPSAAAQMNGASTITLTGSGLLFLLCIAVTSFGVFLILKRKRRR